MGEFRGTTRISLSLVLSAAYTSKQLLRKFYSRYQATPISGHGPQQPPFRIDYSAPLLLFAAQRSAIYLTCSKKA